MQSGILYRDTLVETRVNILVFAHRLHLCNTLTAYRIKIYILLFNYQQLIYSLSFLFFFSIDSTKYYTNNYNSQIYLFYRLKLTLDQFLVLTLSYSPILYTLMAFYYTYSISLTIFLYCLILHRENSKRKDTRIVEKQLATKQD